jgi:hypothetical protein
MGSREDESSDAVTWIVVSPVTRPDCCLVEDYVLIFLENRAESLGRFGQRLKRNNPCSRKAPPRDQSKLAAVGSYVNNRLAV